MVEAYSEVNAPEWAEAMQESEAVVDVFDGVAGGGLVFLADGDSLAGARLWGEGVGVANMGEEGMEGQSSTLCMITVDVEFASVRAVVVFEGGVEGVVVVR